MLHMQVVNYKRKLWEGMAVVVEAVGGGKQATRRARSCGHVPPLYVDCNPANANQFVNLSTITEIQK